MPTNLFLLPIYGANQNDYKVTEVPVDMLFNAATVQVQEIAPTIYAGTTCNAAVYLLPTGPSPIQRVFYTDRTVAQVQTLANA
jgi:hypothetical protein